MGKEEENDGKEDASSNNYCYIHTLIQSYDEYDALSKRMSSQLIINNNDDDGTTSMFFRYNSSLTKEWVEPRLQNQKQQQNRRRQRRRQEQQGESNSTSTTNSSTSSSSFASITQEGYSTIASHEDCYLDYAGMMAWIQDYIQQAIDSGLLQAELLDIGDSYLKASNEGGGNDIHVLTLTGRGTNTSTAAPMLLLSSVHGKQRSIVFS